MILSLMSMSEAVNIRLTYEIAQYGGTKDFSSTSGTPTNRGEATLWINLNPTPIFCHKDTKAQRKDKWFQFGKTIFLSSCSLVPWCLGGEIILEK